MDLEQEPLPKGKAVSDTVLSAVAKKVSRRAHSEILSQASSSYGVSSKGTSKSNVQRIVKKVVHETAEKARNYLKDKAGSNIILHYDVKLVKEFTKGKKLARERLALSITCDGEHSLLGVPYCSDATQTEAIIDILRDYEVNDAVKG